MNCSQCNYLKYENDFRSCCAHHHMICKECVENLMDNNVHFCPLCIHENEPLLNNEINNDIRIIMNNVISIINTSRINNRSNIINNINNTNHLINDNINYQYINNPNTNYITGNNDILNNHTNNHSNNHTNNHTNNQLPSN